MTNSELRSKLAEYLSLREALGIRYTGKSVLQSFVQYWEQHVNGLSIHAQDTLDWACNSPSRRTISAQHARVILARGFLKHLKVSVPDIEIPSIHSIATPCRPTPYIFSPLDLIKLLEATGRLSTRRSIHPYTLQTLLGLMASTGLRTCEVIKMTISDVQLNQEPPRLLIRWTKFDKSRWVPLHATTADRLRAYLKWRQRLTGSSDRFFTSKGGRQLNRLALRRAFLEVVQHLDVQGQSGQRRPCLHSLRHTFAVHRLRQWYEDGADARALSPSLSVYMGHVNPTASYRYFSATPELMGAAAQLFEIYAEAGGVK